MDHIRDKINDDVVNELLTKELNNMSVDDRNAMQEEIHGVNSSAITETPELLSRSLNEFQREIDEIERDVPSSSVTKKKVYNIILSRRNQEIEQNRLIRLHSHNQFVGELGTVYTKDHYAMDDDGFRLRFLRVELFDVPKAVARFLNYLNYAYEAWGEIVLERPICIKDLLNNKDEAKLLRQAYIQVLPSRDRSGRKVTFTVAQSVTSDPEEQKCMDKVCFYIHDATTRDCINDQRMGVVALFHLHGLTARNVPLDTFSEFNKILSSVPVRHVAYHVSMPDNPFLRWFKNMMQLKAAETLQKSLRLVTVVGSEQECRYQQNTYGIPTQLYPLTTTGTIKRTYHKQWIKVRQLIEEKYLRNTREQYDAELVENIVECPFLQDVVFRKGTPSLDHFGNVVFRDLMRSYLEERGQTGIRAGQTNRNSDSDATTATESRAFPDRARCQNTAGAKKITTYGDREDQIFCDELIEEIEIKRKGRFLEWNQSLSTWICIKSNPEKSACKIRQKILIAIYHCRRKASQSKQKKARARSNREEHQQQQQPDEVGSAAAGAAASRSSSNNSSGEEDTSNTDNSSYQFVEGGRRAIESSGDSSCFSDCSGRADAASKKRKPNSPPK